MRWLTGSRWSLLKRLSGIGSIFHFSIALNELLRLRRTGGRFQRSISKLSLSCGERDRLRLHWSFPVFTATLPSAFLRAVGYQEEPTPDTLEAAQQAARHALPASTPLALLYSQQLAEAAGGIEHDHESSFTALLSACVNNGRHKPAYCLAAATDSVPPAASESSKATTASNHARRLAYVAGYLGFPDSG